jgi:transposase
VVKDSKTAAGTVLGYIKELYKHEKDLRSELENKTITKEDFVAERKAECLPVLTAFYRWLVETQPRVLPSSELGKAIAYALGQWHILIHYLDYWETTPDNNAAERAIKPFVMGRKNWVHSGSPAGAKSSCQLYSLIETARANGLDPYWYLVELYTRVPQMTDKDDWASLLPWNIKLSKPLPPFYNSAGN